MRTETSPDSALAERDLTELDCIVLCNVARFARQEALALDAFTRSGGALVVFLGDQVQIDNYNETLSGDRPGSALLPARIAALSGAPTTMT